VASIRKRILTCLVVVSLAVAACGDSSDAESTTTTAELTATSLIEEPTTSASTEGPTTELIGSWHRGQTCAEMLAAFQEAGLAESHVGWLQGNFFGGEPGPASGDPCAGAAEGALEHDHFFTDAGGFGSHDENGEEVDHGDFEAVNSGTVSFPSHATEFGYDGDLTVAYSVDGDVVTFDVALPDPCIDQCADAYAWALSAFASGPWYRGEVPQ